jgi:hypothetical protein
MNTFRNWSFLRQILLVDAVSSGLMGIGLVACSVVLGAVLELPAGLLREAGLALIPFALGVAWLATRERPARWAVWTVIGLNALWVVDSIALLTTDWVQPNVVGYAFVVGQALVVGAFAELEYSALRRSAATA